MFYSNQILAEYDPFGSDLVWRDFRSKPLKNSLFQLVQVYEILMLKPNRNQLKRKRKVEMIKNIKNKLIFLG